MDHVEETISTYDAIADDYHNVVTTGRDSAEFKKWNTAVIERFVNLLPGKKVIVPACGPGQDSRALAELGLTVKSFDLSEGMLKVAKSLDPNGTYLRLDLRNIGSLGEGFDGLFAQGCLYHLSRCELESFLCDAQAMLAEGGVLFCNLKLGLGESFAEKPSQLYPGEEDEHKRLEGRRFYSYYSLDEMHHLFRDFEIVEEWNKHIHKQGVMEFFLRKRRK